MHGKKHRCTRLLVPVVEIGKKCRVRREELSGKAFGSLMYEMDMSTYRGGDYRKYGLDESIWRTERNEG